MKHYRQAYSEGETLWTMSVIDTDVTITGKHIVQVKHCGQCLG